jgi:hypothetical protein
MSQASEHFCEWKDCSNVAAKHVVCSESQMTGLSEKGYGIQLLTWHVDLCAEHLANLPERFSINNELELGQPCTEACSSKERRA